jgi:hypothetical protein
MSNEGAVIVIGAGLSGKLSGKYILEAFVFEVSYWMRHMIVDQHYTQNAFRQTLRINLLSRKILSIKICDFAIYSYMNSQSGLVSTQVPN